MGVRKLRRRREMTGLTQRQLARLAGVDRVTIAFHETGDLNLSKEQAAAVHTVLERKLRERAVAIAKELGQVVGTTRA